MKIKKTYDDKLTPVVKGLEERYVNEARSRAKDFDSVAEEISPLYKSYKDTYYLPLQDQDKATLLANYEARKRVFGESEAQTYLSTQIQDKIAKNQPFGEKIMEWFSWNGYECNGGCCNDSICIRFIIYYSN